MFGGGGLHTTTQRFVGRNPELAQMSGLLDQAAEGVAHTVVLQGEQGIGKTCLCDEVCVRARERGFEVAMGSAYQLGPLQAFGLLHELAGCPPELRIPELGTRSRLSPRQPFLADTRAGYESRLPESLAAACAAVLEKAESAPLLAICDDLQWADSASIQALEFLCRHIVGKRCLLVLVCRESDLSADSPLVGALGQLLPLPHCSRLTLEGLSVDEARELLNQLAPGPVPSDVARALREDTGGNPVFLREMAKALDVAAIEKGEKPAISQTLADVVRARLSRLGGSCRQALSAASVFGEVFSYADLESISALAEWKLIAALEDALQAGLIEEAGPTDTGPMYRFSHSLYRRAIYEFVSSARRQALHYHCAENLLAVGGEERAEGIAYHLGAISPPVRPNDTLRFAMLAAQHAQRVLAHRDAVRYWRIALRAAEALKRASAAQLAEIRLGLARSLRLAGDWTEARDLMAQALNYYEGTGDTETAARICTEIGEELWWQAENHGAEGWLRRAIQLCGSDSVNTKRWALGMLGGTLAALQRPQEGLAALSEATDLVGEEAPDELASELLGWRSLVCYGLGKDQEAETCLVGVLERLERVQDHSRAAHAAASLGRSRLAMLDLSGAREFADRASRHARESGDATVDMRARFLEYLVRATLGDWSKAQSVCESWVRLASAMGPFPSATAEMCLACCHQARGEFKEAARLMQCAAPRLSTMTSLGQAHQALLFAIEGDRELAGLCAHAAAEKIIGEHRKRKTNGLEVLSVAAVVLDDRDLARACESRLSSRSEPLSLGYMPVSLGRARGAVYTRLGRWNEGIEQFKTALEHLEAAGAPYEAAQTCLDYARARTRRGRKGDASRAAQLEDRAVVILADLGMRPPAMLPQSINNGERRGGDYNRGNHNHDLTGRELEVLSLLRWGHTNAEIARRLVISPRTVDRHVLNIYHKLDVGNRAAAAAFAVQFELQAQEGRSNG